MNAILEESVTAPAGRAAGTTTRGPLSITDTRTARSRSADARSRSVVRGRDLPTLHKALDAYVVKGATPVDYNKEEDAA